MPERGEGHKAKLSEIQQLVSEDLSLQSSDKATRTALIAELEAHRDVMKKGARANNAAAAADFRGTLENIHNEVR